MKPPPFTRFLLPALAALMLVTLLLSTACAPSAEMIATLTLLPGTFTPLPPTPWPTATREATLSPADATALANGSATRMPSVLSTADIATRAAIDATVAAAGTGDATATAVAATADASATKEAATGCPTSRYDKTLPARPTSYKGQHFDMQHLPAGLTLKGSGLLESSNFGWTHVTWEGQDVYWIQKLICRDMASKAYWEIVDVMPLPKLDAAKNEVISELCFQGDQPIPFALAYGTYDPGKPASVINNFHGRPLKITAAWQMKDTFVPLDTSGLTCIVQ